MGKQSLLAFYVALMFCTSASAITDLFPKPETLEDRLFKLPCYWSSTGACTCQGFISISNNPLLTGTIPERLSRCTGVTTLLLSRNHLIGTIPSSLGQLTNLKSIFLDQNNLEGTLPSTLGRLTSLSFLTLSDNANLEGTLPREMSSLTKLGSWGLYTANTDLCGPMPPGLKQPADGPLPDCSSAALDQGGFPKRYSWLWLRENAPYEGCIPMTTDGRPRVFPPGRATNNGVTGITPNGESDGTCDQCPVDPNDTVKIGGEPGAGRCVVVRPEGLDFPPPRFCQGIVTCPGQDFHNPAYSECVCTTPGADDGFGGVELYGPEVNALPTRVTPICGSVNNVGGQGVAKISDGCEVVVPKESTDALCDRFDILGGCLGRRIEDGAAAVADGTTDFFKGLLAG